MVASLVPLTLRLLLVLTRLTGTLLLILVLLNLVIDHLAHQVRPDVELKGHPVPVLSGDRKELVRSKRQRRQLVAVAMLLGGVVQALVVGARLDDLVDELNPTERKRRVSWLVTISWTGRGRMEGQMIEGFGGGCTGCVGEEGGSGLRSCWEGICEKGHRGGLDLKMSVWDGGVLEKLPRSGMCTVCSSAP